MSHKGVQDCKVEIAALLKRAALNMELQGDEPLVVLVDSAARMIAEVKDDTNRKAMAKAIAESFCAMVEMIYNKEIAFSKYEKVRSVH